MSSLDLSPKPVCRAAKMSLEKCYFYCRVRVAVAAETTSTTNDVATKVTATLPSEEDAT